MANPSTPSKKIRNGSNVPWPYVKLFLADLNALDFQNVKPDELIAISKEICLNPVLPLGSTGILEYYIHCSALAPGSLNHNGGRDERAHVPELLHNLFFTNINGNPNARSSRLALPLGRLHASHHHEKYLSLSRWVVFLDQTHLLWALYADGTDERETASYPQVYKEALGTAFGARRAEGEKVVLIGSLKTISFKEGVDLSDFKIQTGTEWSTTLTDIDIRKPLASPTAVKCLLDTDNRLLGIPSISVSETHDILSQHTYGYLDFCKDIQKSTQDNGFIVGRKLMDAAWSKAMYLVGEFSKGKSILWHAGASSVSIAGIQLSKVGGASAVYVTAGSQDKIDFCVNELGATGGFNYRTQNWSEEIVKATGGTRPPFNTSSGNMGEALYRSLAR